MDLHAWEVTREIQYKTGVNCPVVPSCRRVVIQQSLQSGGCRCKPSAPALSQQTGWLSRAPWWMLTHSSDHLPRTRHQTPACTQTPEPNTQSNSSVDIRLCPRCCPLLSHSEHISRWFSEIISFWYYIKTWNHPQHWNYYNIAREWQEPRAKLQSLKIWWGFQKFFEICS